MDIIDILLAKKMTSQGQVDTYAAKAKAAAEDALAARSDADAAVQTITDAADTITATQTRADEVLDQANSTIADLNAAIEAIEDQGLDVAAVHNEIKKVQLTKESDNTSSAVTTNLELKYPDNSIANISAVDKNYKSTGTNEDGGMTQKAITEALAAKANSADVATKSYVDSAIAAIPTTGGTADLGGGNAGSIVVVGEDGNIKPGEVSEDAIIEALIKAGTYDIENAIGLEIDYANSAFRRTQEAEGKTKGADFNAYVMYSGRMRCNVSDNGEITAFYGDSNYKDDGSNGQVMIYQPKFYYQRTSIKTETTSFGKAIRKEALIISTKKQTGFKCHPIFMDGDTELDYVLLPAYEASVDENNKLSSVAGVKPISYISIDQAEAYAQARGTGWHITNLAAESANQMLEMVEFGTLNSQTALEAGITTISSTAGTSCASLTGSTASLGNNTGAASATTNEINGTTVSYSSAGTRAISYRGMENPWGNLWKFIGGFNIVRNESTNGGVPQVCTSLDYANGTYEQLGFKLPTSWGWISAMGQCDTNYDWIFLPIECNGTSALPVGDILYVNTSASGTLIGTLGGAWSFQERAGAFAYACDHLKTDSTQYQYGARLMFKPTKNAIYNANVNKWIQKVGG